MEKYVAYYRVSTKQQGRSGLGLAAQREIIGRFIGEDKVLVSEYEEIESGRKDKREFLLTAIAHAKREKAKLLIARLDRFSRRVSFIANLMEEGIGLTVAEMPTATDFQLHIFAALAQEERRLISERTKAALQQAKKRGVELGKNGRVLAERNREEKERFREYLLEKIPNASMMTLSEIARRLKESGQLTRRGVGFSLNSVERYFNNPIYGQI
jgi:DNA invertase Pin-like site-specific DNA recombinase